MSIFSFLKFELFIVEFLAVELYAFLIYFEYNTLSHLWFANIFSYSVSFLCILCMVSLVVQKPCGLLACSCFYCLCFW